LEVSRNELSRMAAEGISEEEFQRSLGQIAGSSALALEDSETRMGRLASAELGTGELYDLDASLERFGAVTASEIAAIASVFANAPLTVVAVGDIAKSGIRL